MTASRTNQADNAAEQAAFAAAAGLSIVAGEERPADRLVWAKGAADDLRNAVEFIAEMARHANDVEFLATLLTSVREVRALLAECHDQIEDTLVAGMAGLWRVEVPHVGVIVRHSGKKRTRWAHDDLWEAVVDAVLSEPQADENGEVLPPAEAVAVALRRAVGPGYWRTTALRDYGLDPDEFCSTSEGRETVEVVS